MKLVTKIQLINWHYFSNELINLREINFLTGSNSAGKSTVIDAIQAALMGETRSSHFNRAAGKKSERTFRSYLVGTLGEDMDSGTRSLREGKDFTSYVVLEFYDDIKHENFCIGLTADVYSDASDEKKSWFILDDILPTGQFIKNGKTTDSTSFLKWGRQERAGKFQSFDNAKQFRKSVLRRVNVFDEKVFMLLRKAIAFEPISNIEEFITTNICDIEENINTLAMQEDIRSYQLTEQAAKDTEQKLNALAEICKKYSEVNNLRARKQLQQFFIDYGYYRDEQEKLSEAKAKVNELYAKIAECQSLSERLAAEAEALKDAHEQLVAEKTQFLSESRKDILEVQRDAVQKEINDACEDEKKLISSVLNNTGKWIGKCDVMLGEAADFKSDSEENAAHAIENLKKMLNRVVKFSEKSFGETSEKYFADIKAAYEQALVLSKPIEEHYSAEKNSKTQRKNELEQEIAVLNSGKKYFPPKAEKLKSAIQSGLSEKYNREIKVEFLSDVIDITDADWKNAVEGVLANDRMNIIVPPECFMDAYQIYKRVHKAIGVHEYSVVDLERVFADEQTVKAGSLAQVVSCEDEYVRAYIDFLLGRVIRCYDEEKLRDNRVSVTRDCMIYRNYAVKPINPFHYEHPYIGQKSIAEQLLQKNKELELVNAQLFEISSHLRNTKAFTESEWFVNRTFLDNIAAPAFEAHFALPDLRDKLRDIADKLSKIDTARLEEIESAIKQNNKLINENSKKQKDVLVETTQNREKLTSLCEREIPQLERSIHERKSSISEQYSDEFVEQRAIPEFEKRLSQYGTPRTAAEAFINPVKQTESLLKTAEDMLREKRSEYNNAFHLSFNISDTETNDDFEQDYKRISEIELPAFAERITRAKEVAMESFRNDFVNKLKSHIQSVIDHIKELNKALAKARFGNITYKFECKPNPDYIDYYNMIMAAEEGETLFSYDFREKYKDTIDNLFAQIEAFDGSDSAAAEAVEKLSRYSTYLSFDLLSIDANGITEKLSKTITAKSGGEIQTPFYVAMLASFVQLYKVFDTRNQVDNTMRLVIFDEAFNKMDPERIAKSISMLREYGLQAIICSPTDKADNIAPLCDKTLLVDKQDDGKGGYRSTVIEWTKEMGDIKCSTETVS